MHINLPTAERASINSEGLGLTYGFANSVDDGESHTTDPTSVWKEARVNDSAVIGNRVK